MNKVICGLLLWAICSAATLASSIDLPANAILGDVTIVRKNIFGEADVPQPMVPTVVNRLHIVTREKVIRREIWLKPGDPITPVDIEELERNIRALDLFADVDISVAQGSGEDSSSPNVDLTITTRDRLSIVFSAGGSFLGGIGEVKFSVGDKNLLGLGHQLLFGYAQNTEGELLGSIAYDNVLVYGTDVYAGAQLGRTEEGDFSRVFVQNRFQNFSDRHSWAAEFSSEETRVDYYEQGESIAEVPRTKSQLKLNRLIRSGNSRYNWRYGPLLEFKQFAYGTPTGPDAGSIDVPLDSQQTYIGAFLGFNRIREYRKLTWLDTLSYKQDISLGRGADIAIGAESTTTDENTLTRPLLNVNGWSRNALSQHNYLNAGLGSSFRLGNDGLDSASVSAALTWFNTRFRNQTIAARLRLETAFDDTGLPPTQTLGEDDGLRGYPAREFNGEQSLLINLENRTKTPIKLYSFEFGVASFFDAGWVSDRSANLDELLNDTHSSVGVGLRIGSRAILGKGLIRVDFAYPFDDDPARDYQPTFSMALGHVFGFKP